MHRWSWICVSEGGRRVPEDSGAAPVQSASRSSPGLDRPSKVKEKVARGRKVSAWRTFLVPEAAYVTRATASTAGDLHSGRLSGTRAGQQDTTGPGCGDKAFCLARRAPRSLWPGSSRWRERLRGFCGESHQQKLSTGVGRSGARSRPRQWKTRPFQTQPPEQSVSRWRWSLDGRGRQLSTRPQLPAAAESRPCPRALTGRDRHGQRTKQLHRQMTQGPHHLPPSHWVDLPVSTHRVPYNQTTEGRVREGGLACPV